MRKKINKPIIRPYWISNCNPNLVHWASFLTLFLSPACFCPLPQVAPQSTCHFNRVPALDTSRSREKQPSANLDLWLFTLPRHSSTLTSIPLWLGANYLNSTASDAHHWETQLSDDDAINFLKAQIHRRPQFVHRSISVAAAASCDYFTRTESQEL